MTEVRIAEPQSNVKQILSRIYELLCTKSRVEGRIQNEDNKTRLASVNFWFVTSKENGSYLVYDSNPELWKKDIIDVMIEDIEKIEYELLYRHAAF